MNKIIIIGFIMMTISILLLIFRLVEDKVNVISIILNAPFELQIWILFIFLLSTIGSLLVIFGITDKVDKLKTKEGEKKV